MDLAKIKITIVILLCFWLFPFTGRAESKGEDCISCFDSGMFLTNSHSQGIKDGSHPSVDSNTESQPVNKDKCPERSEFDEDWLKYSDLDDRAPLGSRSIEAQNAYQTRQAVIEKQGQAWLIKRDMEIDRLSRLELRKYREALVLNQKTNLLKTFWRLSWITYDTIKSARGTGESYSKLFSGTANAVQFVGELAAVGRAMTPADSKVAINTGTMEGKVNSALRAGWVSTLQEFDYAQLGDPIKAGTAVFEEAVKQNFPTADISQKEIEILRTQHLQKREIDDVLQRNYRENFKRQKEVTDLENNIEILLNKLADWEKKEKARVWDLINDNCD